VEISGIAFTQILPFVITSRLSVGLTQPTVLWILGVSCPMEKVAIVNWALYQL